MSARLNSQAGRGAIQGFVAKLLSPIAEALADPSVSEILINGPDEIFVERAGRLERIAATFSNEEALLSALRAVAQSLGRPLDTSHPIVEGRLPDGSRIEALIAPLVQTGASVAIRRHAGARLSVQELVRYGSLSLGQVEALRRCLGDGKNVLVSGGTGSGKTSLLNCLASFIPDGQRVITIEDARELSLQQSHVVSLEARPADSEGRGAVTIADLFRASLRLRPDRIVIGELRGREAFDLIQAMTSGHGGSMSTLHASGPADALRRLEAMALERGLDVPLSALRQQIASAVDVIVQVDRKPDGSRRVTQIAAVEPTLAEGQYVLSPLPCPEPDDGAPGAESTFSLHFETGMVSP